MQISYHPYQWMPWLILLLILGALGHAAVAVHHLEKQTIESVGESLERVAADVADKFDLFLFERYGDMQVMAKSGIFHRDVQAIEQYLALLHKAYPAYEWLAVTDADGHILAATDSSSVGIDRSRTSWFQQVRRKEGGVYIQEVTSSPDLPELLAVIFAAPVLGEQGEFLGAVASRVGFTVVREIVERTVLPLELSENRSAEGEWLLLDSDGTLILDSKLGEEGEVNLRELGVESAVVSASGNSGHVQEWHIRRGVEIIRGYARTKGRGDFPGLDWTVLISLDRSLILAPLHQVIWNLGLAGSVLFVPLLALLVWFTRRLRLEWSQAQDEAARAVEAEHQYRIARNQLADVLDYAPDPIFFCDTGGKITQFSLGAVRVLGYDAEATVSKDVKDLLADPNQWASLVSELNMKGEVIGREVEFRKPDGHTVNISLTLTTLRDAEGRIIGAVALCKDITAAKQTEESLRTSNEELEHFVYAISHDLQAPLRGIQGFAVLLLKRAVERLDQQERHYLTRIQKGAERMEGLIQDLLEYSRIERVTHPWELLNMEQIVLQVRSGLEDRLSFANIDFRIDNSLPYIYGDRVRLGQLWDNLLSNAIKYANPEERPVIRIGCQRNEHHFIFYIRDNGIGIAPEFHAKIFGIFNRLHTHEQIEGSGIGLAIVKRIVEFHGGKIWVESAEGEGSTFLFTLPKIVDGHQRKPPGDVIQDNETSQEIGGSFGSGVEKL